MIYEPQSKHRIQLLVVAALLLLAGVAVFVWSQNRSNSGAGGEVFCTMEAKICPDGSAVGRTGPDCEFSPCPGAGDDQTGELEVKPSWYPNGLDTTYISVEIWPPLVAVESDGYQLDCPETAPESSLPESVTLRQVEGREFCVRASQGGVAGSVYNRYVYSTVIDRKVVSLDFGLRYASCANFPGTERGACERERELFNPDILAYQVASNLAKIRNFEACIEAGLPLLRSNPGQCQTPDGRLFTKQTNATWEQVVEAIADCEAEAVFQAHSQIVELELKNGQRLVAVEPEIDDVFEIVQNHEKQCGRIPMATE